MYLLQLREYISGKIGLTLIIRKKSQGNAIRYLTQSGRIRIHVKKKKE